MTSPPSATKNNRFHVDNHSFLSKTISLKSPVKYLAIVLAHVFEYHDLYSIIYASDMTCMISRPQTRTGTRSAPRARAPTPAVYRPLPTFLSRASCRRCPARRNASRGRLSTRVAATRAWALTTRCRPCPRRATRAWRASAAAAPRRGVRTQTHPTIYVPVLQCLGTFLITTIFNSYRQSLSARLVSVCLLTLIIFSCSLSRSVFSR